MWNRGVPGSRRPAARLDLAEFAPRRVLSLTGRRTDAFMEELARPSVVSGRVPGELPARYARAPGAPKSGRVNRAGSCPVEWWNLSDPS
jgi:hypothetical protein